MDNNIKIDETYYKAIAEHKGMHLTPLQGEVLAYILHNRIVSSKSIQLFWSIDEITVIVILQALIDKELIVKVPTKKQLEELQLSNPDMVLTEAEERQAKMQEITTELRFLGDEYSRKRQELNRIYEKQEKARAELNELTKADWQFYHGG